MVERTARDNDIVILSRRVVMKISDRMAARSSGACLPHIRKTEVQRALAVAVA